MKHKIALLLIVMMIILSGCSLRIEHTEDVEYVVAGCVESLENNILTINVVITDVLYGYDDAYLNGDNVDYVLANYVRSFDISKIEVDENLKNTPYIVKVHVKNGDVTAVEITKQKMYKKNILLYDVENNSKINFTEDVSVEVKLSVDYIDKIYYEMKFTNADNFIFDKLVVESDYSCDAYVIDLDLNDNSKELLIDCEGTSYIIFYNEMKKDLEVYRFTNANLHYEGDGYIEISRNSIITTDNIYFSKNKEKVDKKICKEYKTVYGGERYFYNTFTIDEELEVFEDVTR